MSAAKKVKNHKSQQNDEDAEAANGKLKAKDYDKELARLHVELVKLQLWTVHKGLRAMKSSSRARRRRRRGAPSRQSPSASAHACSVWLRSRRRPSGRKSHQMYVQRYIPHFPAAGEIVDLRPELAVTAAPAWSRVMGFSDEEHLKRFFNMAPGVEKAIVDEGIILLKYWLEVSEAEQTRRLKAQNR